MSWALGSFRLDGCLVLVTGASCGQGTHFVQLLASVGARVAVAAHRADKLRSRIPHQRFGVRSELYSPLLLLASYTGVPTSGSIVAEDGTYLVSSL